MNKEMCMKTSYRHELETAIQAARALLIGAGGVFINRDGTAVTYSRSGASHTSWCFGGAPGVVEYLRKKDWGTIFERSHYDLVVPRKQRKIKGPGVLAGTARRPCPGKPGGITE